MKKMIVLSFFITNIIIFVSLFGVLNYLTESVYYNKNNYIGKIGSHLIIEELIDYQIIEGENYLEEDIETIFFTVIFEKKMYHIWKKILFNENIISILDVEIIINQTSGLNNYSNIFNTTDV